VSGARAPCARSCGGRPRPSFDLRPCRSGPAASAGRGSARRAADRWRPAHQAGFAPRRSARSAARSRPTRTAGLPRPARRQATRGSSRPPTRRGSTTSSGRNGVASRISVASRTPSGSGPSAGPTMMPVTVRRPSGTSTRAPRTAAGDSGGRRYVRSGSAGTGTATEISTPGLAFVLRPRPRPCRSSLSER
jgi:hypothetical protein